MKFNKLSGCVCVCLCVHVYRMDGQLEFYDTGDMSVMNAAEHTAATDLKWDPTGRYVVTSVSIWNQKV